MIKPLKYSVIGVFCIILIAYMVLAGFLYWNENYISKELTDIGAVYSRVTKPHDILLINDGIPSLAKRLELIESAQKSIELEFFIFGLDTSSKLLTNALIKAAQRGVQVKILVDFSISVFKLKPIYAHYLHQFGIEVKYYNTAHSSRIISIQHRSHRKLLIIDSQHVITGGRNVGDDYFSLSSHYNFLDSDILITGPIVKDIQKSFFTYWESDYAKRPDYTKVKELQKPLFQIAKKENAILSFIANKNQAIEKSYYKSNCNDLTFVSDHPGILLSNRQVYQRIVELTNEAKTSIDIETPYLVLREDGHKLLKQVSDRGISLSLLTNSLYSNDAYYTVSAMYFSLNDLAKLDLDLFVHNGESLESSIMALAPNQISKRWGVHSKRAVIDAKHTIIGTYNIDPRSANFNSEVMVICRDNPELAAHTLRNIKERHRISWPLIQDHRLEHAQLFKKASFKQKLLFSLALPLANLFNFLL